MQMSMLDLIKEQFHLENQDIRTYSPLALAYIGDGIYELVVRTMVTGWGNRPVNELNKLSTAYVKAETQAEMIIALKGELTEAEAEAFKRGRNAKPYTKAKNATRADYHKATGFEALMGYLYLTGQTERMLYLIKRGMELTQKGENT